MNILSIEGILNIYIVVRVFGSLFEFATNLKEIWRDNVN